MSTSQQFKPETRIAEHISLAQIFKAIPMDKVKESLCETGSNDLRERDLPNKYMVYFVMALSIFSYCSHTEVFRQLTETLKVMFGPLAKLNIPAKSSLSESRQKLGVAPFENLFRRVVHPIGIPGQTIGAFFGELRIIAVDGVHFSIPDTQKNSDAFGQCSTKNGPAAYPGVRCVGLIECGTRVLFDYELGGVGSSKKSSENALAKKLLPRLNSNYLCLADRLYAYHELWVIAAATGAKLLWRIKDDVNLEFVRMLEDGKSYMAKLCKRDHRGRIVAFVEVRVIEYTTQSPEGKKVKYRLITNVDECQGTANQLAALYHERWEHENTNKEHKQELNILSDVLRSKTPMLVQQELIAMFLAHFATRCIMHEAALSVNEDVDRLSFRHSVNVIRRRAPQVGAFPP